jgi:hypothetical protein
VLDPLRSKKKFTRLKKVNTGPANSNNRIAAAVAAGRLTIFGATMFVIVDCYDAPKCIGQAEMSC